MSYNATGLEIYRDERYKNAGVQQKVNNFPLAVWALRYFSQGLHGLLVSEKPEGANKADIQQMRRIIWHGGGSLWLKRSEFTGALKRGLDFWRSDPSWYMHRVLVAECKGRQGCRSRDCGCCPKRLLDPEQRPEAHHCTVRCRCCHQATEFDC